LVQSGALKRSLVFCGPIRRRSGSSSRAMPKRRVAAWARGFRWGWSACG